MWTKQCFKYLKIYYKKSPRQTSNVNITLQVSCNETDTTQNKYQEKVLEDHYHRLQLLKVHSKQYNPTRWYNYPYWWWILCRESDTQCCFHKVKTTRKKLKENEPLDWEIFKLMYNITTKCYRKHCKHILAPKTNTVIP